MQDESAQLTPKPEGLSLFCGSRAAMNRVLGTPSKVLKL